MDLRYLHYFVTVADELSFTRAAKRLHITQPSLWLQIRKLEGEVGVGLLERQGRGIRLTEAGRVFLEQARKTLAGAKRGIELARQAAHGEIGHLTIGYVTPAEFRVFPKVIPGYRIQSPHVHLSFRDLKTAQILEGLRQDELDIGIIWQPAATEGLDVQELVHEPFVAILPEKHPLASRATVSIRQLSREPLILASRALNPEAFQQIEQLFMDSRAAMNVVYEFESTPQIINFVAMGIGCSVLPDYTRHIRQTDVVYRPLKPASVGKTLSVVKRANTGMLVESFFELIVESVRETPASSRRRR